MPNQKQILEQLSKERQTITQHVDRVNTMVRAGRGVVSLKLHDSKGTHHIINLDPEILPDVRHGLLILLAVKLGEIDADIEEVVATIAAPKEVLA